MALEDPEMGDPEMEAQVQRLTGPNVVVKGGLGLLLARYVTVRLQTKTFIDKLTEPIQMHCKQPMVFAMSIRRQ